MMNRRTATALLRSRAMHIGVAVTVGAVVLSGCSSSNSEYAAFCDASENLAALDYAALTPDQEALSSASEGDFTTLNAWGADAQVTVTDVGAEFQATLDAAPDEDVAGALETYLEALDVLQQLAIVSADAVDFEESMATFDDLGTQLLDKQEDLNAADDVMDVTKQAHCN